MFFSLSIICVLNKFSKQARNVVEYFMCIRLQKQSFVMLMVKWSTFVEHCVPSMKRNHNVNKMYANSQIICTFVRTSSSSIFTAEWLIQSQN